ncbi:hypothetical protein MMC14_010500 [Varicellaria rhodocarpa]|nr:hypothetical protein [Varicellaria rhodocarpa]
MSTPHTIGYIPANTGQEIGVMFGFGGAMVLAMCGYLLLWKVGNKRSARIENERRETLAQKGIYASPSTDSGNMYNEKSEKVTSGNVGYAG